MPELGPYGSVRGALSNGRPYRDRAQRNPSRHRLRVMGFAKSSTHPTGCIKVSAFAPRALAGVAVPPEPQGAAYPDDHRSSEHDLPIDFKKFKTPEEGNA